MENSQDIKEKSKSHLKTLQELKSIFSVTVKDGVRWDTNVYCFFNEESAVKFFREKVEDWVCNTLDYGKEFDEFKDEYCKSCKKCIEMNTLCKIDEENGVDFDCDLVDGFDSLCFVPCGCLKCKEEYLLNVKDCGWSYETGCGALLSIEFSENIINKDKCNEIYDFEICTRC